VSLKGKLAIRNAGKWFAKLQLQNGMKNFRGLESIDLEQYEVDEEEDEDEEDEAGLSEDESSKMRSRKTNVNFCINFIIL
jgi:hypothetical protein